MSCGCDKHPDPTTVSWSAWSTGGGTAQVTVAKSDGSHINWGDVEWVRELLRRAASVPRYACDLCGLDITLTQEQQDAARLTGRVKRPPCPETKDGKHIVTDDQLLRTSQGANGAVERIIGNCWNMFKDPSMPLWWCLREERKKEWRELLTEGDPVSMPAGLAEMIAEIPVLESP